MRECQQVGFGHLHCPGVVGRACDHRRCVRLAVEERSNGLTRFRIGNANDRQIAIGQHGIEFCLVEDGIGIIVHGGTVCQRRRDAEGGGHGINTDRMAGLKGGIACLVRNIGRHRAAGDVIRDFDRCKGNLPGAVAEYFARFANPTPSHRDVLPHFSIAGAADSHASGFLGSVDDVVAGNGVDADYWRHGVDGDGAICVLQTRVAYAVLY